MGTPFVRDYDFSQPLDDMWELIPDPGWTCDLAPGGARFESTLEGDGAADVYLRPCSIDGDSMELAFVPGAARGGRLVLGLISGFEHALFELNLSTGDLQLTSHEHHKVQPRLRAKVPTAFRTLTMVRQRDVLPGLPYAGCSLALVLDGQEVARCGQIDFLPESLMKFGLKGPGRMSLARVSFRGPERPRPEYVRVGIWQQRIKPTTVANVDGLLEGVRQAAAAGVRILVTPETSLTGLRPASPELSDRKLIQEELARFKREIAKIPDAPYTLVGYPDWVPGSEFDDGAELAEVKVNSHRFVRPDGKLGPLMAKVHSCEDGLWHGRKYNCVRIAGVEVAVGVCHDGHYRDVWALGVMAGARLCLHPTAGGAPAGPAGQQIPELAKSYRGLGTPLDCFWVTVNSQGGGAIVYPTTNRKYRDTVLAISKDFSTENPTYPAYSAMNDSLAHANCRLWDATGCYPLRTLRAGRRAYSHWSALMPQVVDV